MKNVISFIAKKEQKELTAKQQVLECCYGEHDRLDAFVDEQSLHVQDHTLFLGFLVYLQQHHLEAKNVFRDVFTMPRYRFERVYNMKWWSVAQLGLTFLAILKDNDKVQYNQFFQLEQN